MKKAKRIAKYLAKGEVLTKQEKSNVENFFKVLYQESWKK